jgi:hypothetical protein
MDVHGDLSKISNITKNIFVSGIYPLDEDCGLIKKFKIKYILSCVDQHYISGIHDKIMSDNPDVTILYLPYNDDIDQNLWTKYKNKMFTVKYSISTEEFDEFSKQLSIYNNKPMIEVGYHFINMAVELNQNILVHCMAGISRSVSIVIYYLMKKYHINYKDALNTVRKRREIANPNNSFRLQLSEYQKKRDQFTEKDADNIITSTKYL